MRQLAYIDPATGSLFVQAVIGTFLAVGVVFRRYIRAAFQKVKLAFSRRAVADEDE